MTEKEEKIFLEYFDEKKLQSSECIRNYKNRKVVFFKEIEGERYYIKKYVPYRYSEKRMALGLQRDRVEHYRFISEKLKKLKVKHAEPYYTQIKKYSFFKRASILVTKDGGVTLEKYIDNFEDHKEWFKYFFDLFVYLCKNEIYCTDYNPDGMLVDNNEELSLIDLDAYRTKFIVTRKFKRHVIKCLRKIYTDIERTKEFEEYCKEEIKRVIKELGWKE